jgi:hypothetical protein
VLQKNRVLTVKEALAKKEANRLKRQAVVDKRNATLVWITRNKIKNKHKACRVAARKLERERKKQVELLQKAKEFVPLELLKPILDPELSITKADIKLELRKRLISNPAALGLEINSILRNMQTAGSPTNRGVRDDPFTLQEDYVSFSGLDNRDYLE